MLQVLGRKTSSNVQKVLWCCGELGLPFEREDVGGPFGRTRDPDYLALNPNGLVPSIVDDGFVLWESNTIVRYLGAKHGQGTLWPEGAQPRAEVEKWMDWSLSVLDPAISDAFIGLVRTPPEERDGAAIDASRDATATAIAILDAALRGETFVAAGHLTTADIALGPVTHRWFNLEIEREDYPHLRAWYDRLLQRPAYREHVALPLT